MIAKEKKILDDQLATQLIAQASCVAVTFIAAPAHEVLRVNSPIHCCY
jgi:hypothetical protein